MFHGVLVGEGDRQDALYQHQSIGQQVGRQTQEAGQCVPKNRSLYNPELKKQVSVMHQPIKVPYNPEPKKQLSVINQSKFRAIQSSRSRSVSSTNQNSVPHRVQEASQCHQPIKVPFHPELKKQVNVINQSAFCTT